MLADVAEAQGPQESIQQGVHQHVRIAVTVQSEAVRVVQVDASQDEGAPLHESMNVVTMADA